VGGPAVTRCLVITRDRATVTARCIASLETCQRIDVVIVDHGSTYPPMLDYLDRSGHPVIYAGDRPPHALWDGDLLAGLVGDSRYLVTDPDIVLDSPADWLDRLGEELDCGDVVKAGLGLRLDDLPDTQLAAKVRAWEAPFWTSRRPSGAWAAPVDTTLALYPPVRSGGFRLAPAARLDSPYLIRHLPWYGDDDPAESSYYRARAHPGSSHWINGGW
jgi:hypothetical protein